MSDHSTPPHGHHEPDGDHHEKKAWYYDPTWIVVIIALILLGGFLIGHFTKDDSTKSSPVTTAPAEPVVVPRGPVSSSQPNVITVPDQQPAGGAEVIVTAPKDYNVKVEVTEW